MWYLSSDNDNRILYVVPNIKEVVIGRSTDGQTCNFAILDDPSISRKHAILSVAGNDLFVQDLGSRYGTFINDSSEKLPANSNMRLNKGDIIKFGKMNSIWKVHEVNLTTCTSTLKGENLELVRSIVSKIGGVLKTEWEESCSFLTMPVITLTIKVVLALVQGCNIVTLDFWNKCLEAVNNNTKLPDPQNFVPTVVETTLNKEVVSFLPNEQRKTIFASKKFVFFHKRQYEMYKNVLMKSSATPVLFSEAKLTKSSLCEQGVILIQDNKVYASQETQHQRSQINEILNYLKSKGKRPVPESDIGLALLFCSTEKYCNPDFNISHEIIKQTCVNKPANILAFESQEAQNSVNKTDNIVVDESLTAIDNLLENVTKRKLSEDHDDIQSNANKKLATGQPLVPDDTVNKRKLSEDYSSNPSKKVALQNNTENDDLFNFITSDNSATDNKSENETSKRLNFAKPTKRKAEVDDDDDMFNFIQINKPKPNETDIKPEPVDEQSNVTHTKKTGNITAEEISAMRGTKLAELMRNSVDTDKYATKQSIKKEIKDDLDEKMRELDLGSTVVIIRDDLIIKKEPIEVEGTSSSVRNFKKFKKVWPVKMQVTVLPKISMSMTTVGGN